MPCPVIDITRGLFFDQLSWSSHGAREVGLRPLDEGDELIGTGGGLAISRRLPVGGSGGPGDGRRVTERRLPSQADERGAIRALGEDHELVLDVLLLRRVDVQEEQIVPPRL